MPTNISRNQAALLDQCTGLGIGESTRTITCPWCQANSPGSFNVTRQHDGIAYCCFRASCDNGKGFIPLVSNTKHALKQSVKPEFDDFRLELNTVPTKIIQEISKRYQIDDIHNYAKYNAQYGLVFTITDLFKNVIGYSSKNLFNTKPKTNTWRIAEGTFLYEFWSLGRATNPVFLVEDILSCIKIGSLGFNAIALLGSHITDLQALEIYRRGYRHIVLALDNDTWKQGKPPKLQKKFRLFFDSFNLLYIEQDPKDIDKDQLLTILEELDGRTRKKNTSQPTTRAKSI